MAASADTPGELWRAAADLDPARPFATAYDEDTGGRVELSYATFDNWVAKTANMIVDGLGAEPGERVALALPVHWQSLVWLLACWSTGMTVVPVTGAEVPDDAGDIVVADASRIDAALDSGAREVVGASLHPLGAPLASCPPAALDYAVEVRGYGDRFTPMARVDPAAAALDGDARFSGSDLVARAREKAKGWELTSADRVAMITSAADSLSVLGADLSCFLAPVAAAVPLVLTPSTGAADLRSRLGMERVTAIIGARPGTPMPTGDIRLLH
ncbi:MAG: TIGR03089 family protein [Nocardiopsaceae bacterium]|nr:TIGR03089 family protein [Nocardiopsaceae bacterium]